MKRTIAALLLGAILLAPRPVAAQIMNTLRGFDRREPDFSGAIGASFSQEGGNTEKFSASGGLRIQWQDGTQRVRFFADGDHEEVDGKRTGQSFALHLRHNRRLSAERLHSLLFAQLQRDPFQRLEARTLLGVGARVDVLHRERLYAAFGAAHMLEFEKLEDRDDVPTDQRLSIFATATGDLSEQASLDFLMFLQPLWEDLGDFRTTATASLDVAVISRLSVVVGAGVTYDSEPPDDVDETDWTVSTGFTWKL